MLESCCNEKMVLGWSFKVRFQILREFICTLTLLSISVSLSHSLKLHLSADGVEVFLNPDKVLHQVDEKFLSICINPRIVTKFDGVFNPRWDRSPSKRDCLECILYNLLSYLFKALIISRHIWHSFLWWQRALVIWDFYWPPRCLRMKFWIWDFQILLHSIVGMRGYKG